MSFEKYFCLRDDDTNYFTTVEELKIAYGSLWGTIPITLATIPFAHGSERKIIDVEFPYEKKFENLRQWELNANEEELSEYHKVHPIGDNKELVSELRKMISVGKIEIAQHGVYHRYSEFGAELLGDRMSFAELRDGKEYLEKVFGTPIKTLIPPGNVIDLTVLHYMDSLDMHLLTSAKIRAKNRWETLMTYIQHPVSIIDKLKKGAQPLHHRYGVSYFESHTFESGSDPRKLLYVIEKDLSECGFSAMGTHYRFLKDASNRDKYLSIIDKITKIGNVKFVTAEEYYSKAISLK